VLAAGDVPSTLIACQEQNTVRTDVPKVQVLNVHTDPGSLPARVSTHAPHGARLVVACIITPVTLAKSINMRFN
jgi:hypothetical protein